MHTFASRKKSDKIYMYKKIITLLIVLTSTICVNAQDFAPKSFNPLKYRVVYYDKEKQQWTTESMRACYSNDRVAIQESVTFIDENSKERTFTPNDARQFYIKKEGKASLLYTDTKAYFSVDFTYNGQKKKAFLLRESYDKTDDITFYVYYLDFNKLVYYFKQGEDGEVLPASDDPKTGYVSPLHTLLRQKAGGNADKFEGYYDANNMTSKKYLEARKTIKSGSIYSTSKFRWGVTANAGMFSPNIDNYDFDSKFGAAVGVFANIPIYMGLSANIEATASKYAYKGSIQKETNQNQAVYNTTEISTPLMLRYSFKYIKGNVIPYIQIGYQPSFALSNKLEYRYKTVVLKDGHEYYDYNTGNQYGYNTIIKDGEEETQKVNSSLLGSAGAEIILPNEHRLYLDIRGLFGNSQYGRSGIMVSASYNL